MGEDDPGDPGRGQPWWVGRVHTRAAAAPAGGAVVVDGDGGDRFAAAPEPDREEVRRSVASAIPFLIAAAIVFAIMFASAQTSPSASVARVLVPVFGVLATLAASRYLLARHPDEPWLGWLLVLAVAVKEFA